MLELEYFLRVAKRLDSRFYNIQYLQSLEFPKQISISYVLRGIKRAIPRELVKISDCRVSSFFKTVPGCRVYNVNSTYVQVLTLFYSLTSTDSAGGGRSAFTPRGIPLNVYVQKPSTQHSWSLKATIGRHFNFSCARNMCGCTVVTVDTSYMISIVSLKM